jgi:hypothetical protein
MPVHENTAPKLSLTCWALFPWSRVSRGFPLAAPALSLTLLSVLVGFCEAALRALTVVCGGGGGCRLGALAGFLSSPWEVMPIPWLWKAPSLLGSDPGCGATVSPPAVQAGPRCRWWGTLALL